MPTQAVTKTHTARARDDSNKSTIHTNPPTTTIHDPRLFKPPFPFPFPSQTQCSRERAKVLYAVLQRGTEAAQAPGAPPPQAEHWNALQVCFVWHVWDRIVTCVCVCVWCSVFCWACVLLPTPHGGYRGMSCCPLYTYVHLHLTQLVCTLTTQQGRFMGMVRA